MLFDSIKIGRLACPNRIWMAPLTRGRAAEPLGVKQIVLTALTMM